MPSNTSGIGEPSRANAQEPIRKFTQQELNMIIHEQVTKSSEEAKKLQKETERGSTSCIYTVLPRLKKFNGESLYEPNMISIGPYYHKHRNEKFQMAENFKGKFFSLLVTERDLDMQINTYKRCLQKVSELEEKIRKCYYEEFKVADIDFLSMMVLDACFIIAIIFKDRSLKAALAWMVPYLYRHFLLLENQIPFFVLEEIYALTHNISDENITYNLKLAALVFFHSGMKTSSFNVNDFVEWYDSQLLCGVPVLHLLDLVRISLTTPFNIRQGRRPFIVKAPFIHCISKLQLAGIKVSQGKALSFLEVKFKKGVIEMPNIAIDDLTRCVLLNCVAFEQCHQISSKYFSVYATFLDCLVNTKEDVEYLRERNVIDNYFTDDSEAADFINRAGKDLVLLNDDEYGIYLEELFEDVDSNHQNGWKWKWASFEREYFDKPWLLLSAAGGILLVLATSFQAVMAFLTYKYTNC